MAQSCVIKPCVRNSKGEVVESKLFKDLLSYLPSRSEAVKYYNLARNKEFLSQVSQDVAFDDNGEITIQDLIKEAKINIDNLEIQNKLQKEIGETALEYKDAVAKAVRFNKEHAFNKNFIALISENNGKWEINIVQNTEENVEQLKRTIAGQELKNRLIYRLTEAGVDVKFIEEDHARYSTENATKNANGLYQLIDFYKNGTSIQLAEEAGHFIMGAMSNSPLAERLLSLLSKDVRDQILKESENENKFLGHNPKKEIAGMLVGQALLNEETGNSTIDKLIRRLISGAKRVLAKVRHDQVAIDKLEAEQTAAQIVEQFNTNDKDKMLTTAIAQNETFYSKQRGAQEIALNTIKQNLAILAKDLKQLDKEVAQMVDSWLLEIERQSYSIEAISSGFAEPMAATTIAYAMKLIADFVASDTFTDLLIKVDGMNQEEFMQALPLNSLKLRIYGKFLQYCDTVTTEGRECFNKNPDLFQSSVDHTAAIPASLNFLGNIEKIENGILTRKSVENYYRCEQMLFGRFCEMFYGAKYVNRMTKMLWGNTKFEIANPDQYSIQEAIQTFFADDSVVSSFLGSMANSNSLAAQIIDKVLKHANFEAQQNTAKAYGQLKQWEEQYGKRINQRHLFELDAEGKFTGNLLDFTDVKPGTPLTVSSKPVLINWGLYEQDYNEAVASWREQFEQDYPNAGEKGSYMQDLLFAEYIRPLKKAWHKEHSVWSSARGYYIPKTDLLNDPANPLSGHRYVNTHQALNDFELEALREYYKIKLALDDKIEGQMPKHRAPQMRGSMVNTVANYNYEGNSGFKSVGKTISHKVIEAFCMIPEDVDAQQAGVYNTSKDNDKKRPFFEFSERTRQIPLFGIHKINDTERLSTDLVHSTLAYAAMANNYNAIRLISNALEIGMDYIAEKGKKSENKEFLSSQFFAKIKNALSRKSFGRMRNYLDKHLYGIGLPKIGRNGLISKLIPATSRLASTVYLAGNVAGGIVNLGTGTIEMWKEAFAGEHYSGKELLSSYMTLVGSLLGIARDAVQAEDISKINLFVRHFDITDNNEQFYRSRYSKGTRILNNLSEIALWLPYSGGSYIMSTLPYIAMAKKQQVYDQYGNKTTLWDAYTIADDGVRIELKEPYFSSIEKTKRYNEFKDAYDATTKILSSQSIWSTLDSYPEVKAFLEEKKLGENSPRNVLLNAIQREMNSQIFADTEEMSFNMKAREVTNRMHGVYNKMDKTMAHRDLLGSLFMTMKGYALGLAQRRFGGITNISKTIEAQRNLGYSIALGGEHEGSLTTIAKMLFNTRSLSDVALLLRATLCPLGKGFQSAMNKRGYGTNQIANTRRNFGDIVALALLYLLKFVGTPKGEGDEDDDLLMGHLYYMATRLLMEQAAYNLPGAMLTEATSVFDAVPAGASIIRDFATLGKLVYGDIMYDYKEDETDPDIRQYFYQKEVPGKAKKGDPKWKIKAIGMIPYWRSAYWLEHPYGATENYMYIRNAKK